MEQGAGTWELRTGHSSHEKGLETLPTDPRKWSKSWMPTLSHERQESHPEVKTPSYIGREGHKFTLPTWGGNSAGKLTETTATTTTHRKTEIGNPGWDRHETPTRDPSRPKRLKDESSSKLFLERTVCDQAKRETVHRGIAEGLTGDRGSGGSCHQTAVTPKARQQKQVQEKVRRP